MSVHNSELYQEFHAVLSDGLNILPDKPEENVNNTLGALWLSAAGKPVSAVLAKEAELPELSDEQQEQLRDKVSERLTGVPLAHITQRQYFMGMDMLASKKALIPRKETEILAKMAIQSIDDVEGDSTVPAVIDVCTGSGNLALAVLRHRKNISIWGADLSEEAVELAKENARHLGLEGKIDFYAGDLLAPFDSDEFKKSVDVIICNPPYILSSNVEKMPDEISGFEPELAFNGGPFGIQILDRIVKESPVFLKDGGWLCLELGAGQGPFVEKRIRKSGLYGEIETACDDDGIVRAIRARHHLVPSN